jgi:metal iron transporter
MAGRAISVADTLFILPFYKPDGTIRRIRAFEVFVSIFVFGVFIMFCIELSLISAPVGEVFKGYLPSRNIFVSSG